MPRTPSPRRAPSDRKRDYDNPGSDNSWYLPEDHPRRKRDEARAEMRDSWRDARARRDEEARQQREQLLRDREERYARREQARRGERRDGRSDSPPRGRDRDTRERSRARDRSRSRERGSHGGRRSASHTSSHGYSGGATWDDVRKSAAGVNSKRTAGDTDLEDYLRRKEPKNREGGKSGG